MVVVLQFYKLSSPDTVYGYIWPPYIPKILETVRQYIPSSQSRCFFPNEEVDLLLDIDEEKLITLREKQQKYKIPDEVTF